MALRVSGKNIDLGEALRSKVEARVAAALSKYFDGSYSGHVTVEKDGTAFRTECVLHLTSGRTLEASGVAHDAHASFDQTAERLENRLRRYKQRLKSKVPGGPAPEPVAYAVLEAPDEDEPVDGQDFHPAIIAETAKPLPRLSVGEAVLELDLTGAPALVFLHAGTGRVNVVYRRRDGAIGWVDPPPGQA